MPLPVTSEETERGEGEEGERLKEKLIRCDRTAWAPIRQVLQEADECVVTCHLAGHMGGGGARLSGDFVSVHLTFASPDAPPPRAVSGGRSRSERCVNNI